MATRESTQSFADTGALAKKLDAVAWGLFFVWMGVAFLTDVGWGAGLMGIGVIVLGSQAARKYFGLPVERFWLVMGAVFLGWGALKLLNIQVGEVPASGSLLPILFIGAGIAMIVSALLRKPRR